MKDNIKVSVIIPAYNCEKYIERCLKSFEKQDFDNYEVICINDGSNDNTLNIIKAYHSKSKLKITLINKKNEGAWKARQDGIKIAKGRYIVFSDADDYVSSEYLKKMYNQIESKKADICVCGFYRIDANTEKIYSTEMVKKKEDIYQNKNFEEIISINTSLWNKIYKASLLKGMYQLSNIPRVMEDMVFLMLVYKNAKKISFLPEPLYNYMVNEGSAMASTNLEDVEKAEKAMLEVKQMYINSNCSSNFIQIVDCVAFLHFGISLMFRLSYTEKEKFKNILEENRKFLNSNFESYKTSRYLSLCRNIIKKSSNNKISIMRIIYGLGLFRLFLKFYRFIIDKLKFDIKW